MRVRPARPDVLVRDPVNPSRIVPADGLDVPRNPHWLRRVIAGDVVIVEDESDSVVENNTHQQARL